MAMKLDMMLKNALVKSIIRDNAEKAWEKSGRIQGYDSMCGGIPECDRHLGYDYYFRLLESSERIRKQMKSSPAGIYISCFGKEPTRKIGVLTRPYGIHLRLDEKDFAMTDKDSSKYSGLTLFDANGSPNLSVSKKNTLKQIIDRDAYKNDKANRKETEWHELEHQHTHTVFPSVCFDLDELISYSNFFALGSNIRIEESEYSHYLKTYCNIEQKQFDKLFSLITKIRDGKSRERFRLKIQRKVWPMLILELKDFYEIYSNYDYLVEKVQGITSQKPL